MMQDQYEDIINLPRHVSKKHPQMPLQDRAAQFAPFAALTGHGAAIRETARLTQDRILMDQDRLEELDSVLMQVRGLLREKGRDGGPGESGPLIHVSFFRPDEKKQGGSYATVSGRVQRIDDYRRLLLLERGMEIPLDSVVDLVLDRED